MRRVLKEPLFHFLLIGAALFAVFGWARVGERSGDDSTIVVSAGRIQQLAGIFAKTWQRPPTKQELQGLIDDFVLEEIYYRQAREMGIDRDDTVIRRRLRQKLEFLTDDAAALVEPSDEELAAYLAENEERFRRDSVYSFRQIYINPEKHGNDGSDGKNGDGLVDYVEKTLAALRAGETVQGDSGLLPESHAGAAGRTVNATFGRGFAEQLDALEMGSWQGPVESGLGVHLVLVQSREPGVVPPLEEIRPVVEREWANEKRIEMREKMNEDLKGDYDIVIEWPEGGE